MGVINPYVLGVVFLTFGGYKSLRSVVVVLMFRGYKFLRSGVVVLMFGGYKSLRLGVINPYVLGL